MKKSVVIAMLLLAGCATPPERIKAAAVGGTCTAADKERLAFLYTQQTRTANRDALGVFMIGVPLGGEDYEAEIAQLKGRCGDLPKKKA